MIVVRQGGIMRSANRRGGHVAAHYGSAGRTGCLNRMPQKGRALSLDLADLAATTADTQRAMMPSMGPRVGRRLHDAGLHACMQSVTMTSLNTTSTSPRPAVVGHELAAGTPRFSGKPEAASVRLGDSQVLSCEVNPDLVAFIRWERDKEPVQLDQRVFTLPSGALVISNATETDAGLYRCVLENIGPTKTSEEAELQVQPETWEERGLEFLRQPPESASRVVGDSVLLPCVVTGYPAAYLRWTHNDQPLEESDGRFQVLGGGSLQIFNLTEEDAGIYQCLAENANNSIEARAELTVQGCYQLDDC
ncbi:hypothetical protein NFI96_003895 [Prochilodus magdalenae]|nr:hypothetical protein NFI96_003895 [Prochilodus magdalenae]